MTGPTETPAALPQGVVTAVTCGFAASKGRLVAGYDADFIAVSTGPLAGDTVLDVTSVWRAGHKVSRPSRPYAQ